MRNSFLEVDIDSISYNIAKIKKWYRGNASNKSRCVWTRGT